MKDGKDRCQTSCLAFPLSGPNAAFSAGMAILQALPMQEKVRSKVEAMLQQLLADSHQAPRPLQCSLAIRDGFAFSLLWSNDLRGIDAHKTYHSDFWVSSSSAQPCPACLLASRLRLAAYQTCYLGGSFLYVRRRQLCQFYSYVLKAEAINLFWVARQVPGHLIAFLLLITRISASVLDEGFRCRQAEWPGVVPPLCYHARRIEVAKDHVHPQRPESHLVPTLHNRPVPELHAALPLAHPHARIVLLMPCPGFSSLCSNLARLGQSPAL